MDAADTGFDYLSSADSPWHDVVHGSVTKQKSPLDQKSNGDYIKEKD